MRSYTTQACGNDLEIRCFADLLEGITDFGKNSGVRADKLPTIQEATEIKREIDSLPPVGRAPAGLEWLVTSGSLLANTATATIPRADMQLFRTALLQRYPAQKTLLTDTSSGSSTDTSEK